MAKSTPVPAKPAIQSDEEAGLEAQEYLNAKAVVEQIEATEKAAIAALKQEFASLRKPHEEVRDDRFARVQAWAEATRGGRKTIKFPNGREFRWRTASSAKLIISDTLDEIVQRLLKRRDWKKFLAVEPKKSALVAHPKVVEETEGLSLERGEYASIG